jgi:integrase/recombinase XerD
MKKITMKSNNNLTFDEAFDKFIRKCEVKNLTKKSIISYQQKIRPFKEFVEEQGINFSDINGDTVDDFIVWARKTRNANDISINSYLRTVRAFTYYCMDNSYLTQFKVHIPKATKKMKETYTDTELNILLKKPNKRECTFTEFKTWAFENFLLGTGVRLSTALDIKIKDIRFEDGLIFLGQTKSRVQQYIPLSKSLALILKEYLEIRGGSPGDYLFCNNYGKKANERTFQQMVQNYNRARGIERSSVHAFRHTFARLYILNGGNAFILQKLMGHSDISVTKEYVDLFGTDLAVGYDRLNPLDNLSNRGSYIRM